MSKSDKITSRTTKWTHADGSTEAVKIGRPFAGTPKVGDTLTCGACGTSLESNIREVRALGWRVRNSSPNMRLVCPACAVETDW